jgi:large subunit ribosomal protein L21
MVELKDVLLIAGNGDVKVGRPTLEGARVIAEVVEHGRDAKIIVFKYKAKTRYRRRRGHRQGYTRLAVRQILTAEGPLEPAEKPKRRRATPKAEAKAPRRARKPKAEAAAPEADRKPVRRARARKAQGEATAEAPAAEKKPARRTPARKPAARGKATKPRRTSKKTESE